MQFTEVLLLLFYTALFAFLISKTKFFKSFGLLPIQIIFIFIVKITAGIFYGYLHRIFYGGGDTMEYFYESKFISDRLISHDYISFLKLTFGINHRPPATDIKDYALAIGYWNDKVAAHIIPVTNRQGIIFNIGSRRTVINSEREF